MTDVRDAVAGALRSLARGDRQQHRIVRQGVVRRLFLVPTLVASSLALAPFAASDVRVVSDSRADARGNGVFGIPAVSRGHGGELLEHRLNTARPSRGTVVRSGAARRPPPAPVPIRNQGYRRVFTDDFKVFSPR